MTERVYVRQLDESQWQWRVLNEDGTWKQDVYVVSSDELIADLKELSLPLCLIVSGHSVVTRTMSVEVTEKKLMSKILPYEMEEELIDPVEDLHFCFGHVEGDTVNLVYLASDELQALVDYLEPSGCDIQHILPDYLLLDQNGFAGILLLENGSVFAKFNDGIGFTSELNVTQFVLSQLSTEESPRDIESLLLIASSVEEIEELKTCIPEEWFSEEKELHVDEQLSHFWDYADPSSISTPLNMRTGTFARQLPFVRWWNMAKIPAYALAAAFVISLSVNFFDYMMAKSEGKKIRAQMQEVYLQAVPNGRKGDEEKRLRALIKGSSGNANSSEPTNLVMLLSGLTKSMQQQKDIELSNFRYSGDQRELQVNILVKGLGELGQFRELMTTNGLDSGSPRTSRQEDKYQASMKISEKK